MLNNCGWHDRARVPGRRRVHVDATGVRAVERGLARVERASGLWGRPSSLTRATPTPHCSHPLTRSQVRTRAVTVTVANPSRGRRDQAASAICPAVAWHRRTPLFYAVRVHCRSLYTERSSLPRPRPHDAFQTRRTDFRGLPVTFKDQLPRSRGSIMKLFAAACVVSALVAQIACEWDMHA